MPALDDPKAEALAQAFALAGNGKATAAAMGLTGPSASATVTEMVKSKPEIKKRAQEIIITKFEKANITATRVMTELARVAFGSAKDLFDEEGNLIPVHLMTDDAAATISGIDVEVQWRGKGENAEAVTVKKIKRVDKMAALNTLAKHFKIVGDEGDGVNALASALADRLNSAKRRMAARDVEDVEVVEQAAPPLAPPNPPRMQFPFPEPEKRPRGRPRKEPKPISKPAPAEPQPQENDDEQLW